MACRSLRAACAIVSLGAASTACTNSLDLQRFHHEPSGAMVGTVTFADLHFAAVAMKPHLNEYFELKILDRNNALQAKAAYAGVTGENFEFYLAKLIPKANPPYRVDFWADHNKSGKYDGIEGGVNEKDHAWRRVLGDPLPDDITVVDGRYEFKFLHDTQFVDILTDLEGNKIAATESLLPFKCAIAGAAGYAGHMIELRVLDHNTNRLTGLFRQGAATATFDAQLTGILDEETPYDILVFADLNDNDKYDVGIDASWTLDATSNNQGVAITLDVATRPMNPITTGAPGE